MEVAIVNCIGAGLLALSPEAPGAEVRGLAARGYSLIAYLVVNGHSRVGQLVEAAAVDLAPLLAGSEPGRSLAARHLEHLPAVMDFRPGRELLSSVDLDDTPTIDPARQIAMRIVAAAAAADAFPDSMLGTETSVRLLSCLLQSLQRHRPLLAELDAGIAAYLAAPVIVDPPKAHAIATTVPADTNAAPDPASPPDGNPIATGRLPMQLAQTIFSALVDNGIGEGLTGASLAAKLTAWQEIAACLSDIAPGEPVAELWADALQTLAGGRLEEAVRLLAESEAIDLRAAESRRGDIKQQLLRAIETRVLRGRIEELRIGYREAASHYAAATRLISPRDRAARWRLVMLQAAAMLRAGTELGEAQALEQACHLHAEALALEPANAADWAATQAGLGEAQLAFGLQREEVGPLEAAAVAFAAALEVHTPISDPLAHASLQSQLGTTLWALGNLEPSTERLVEAAASKRAASEAFAAAGAVAEQAEVERQLVNLRIELGIAA